MISHYSLFMIEVDWVSIFNDWALLISGDMLELVLFVIVINIIVIDVQIPKI